MKGARAEGADDAFIERLALTAKAIEEMAEGVRQVAALPDPVGAITGLTYRPSGIQVGAHARAAGRGRRSSTSRAPT